VDVKLISHSKAEPCILPVIGNQEKDRDIENLVAFCARVSNPSNQTNVDTNKKLLNYLMKHKHWSPFEMVSVCLEITTTRDIARQILRHRSFSFQEFSQRYADPADMGEMFVLREARLQDPTNRQNSLPLDPGYNAAHIELMDEWDRQQQKVINQASKAYKWAIANGIAKEQARAVLPEGNTKSRMYMNGTLRSWIHYIELRADNGTQKEHMDIARACAQVIANIFPPILNNIPE
jgi:thymidylate synthase (FAD)